MKNSIIFFVILSTLSASVLGKPSNVGIPRKKNAREIKIEKKIRESFFDPLNIPDFEAGSFNGVLQVKQTLRNFVLTGLKYINITELDVNIGANTIQCRYEAAKLTANLNYELDGKCLLLPLWGKGYGVVVMNGVKVTVNGSLKNEKGKVKLLYVKISFDLSGGSFNLSSLFGETKFKPLTTLLLSIFNWNYKNIINEILPAYLGLYEKLLPTVWGPIIESS